MYKEILCHIPLSIKVIISLFIGCLDNEKRAAIKSIDEYNDPYFLNLNTREYKSSLKKFLKASLLDGETSKEYVKYLYNDTIELITDNKISNKLPTIICVVKNEQNKLVNFFHHYEKLGKFNYIFIDNDSTDRSVQIMKEHNAVIYKCNGLFSTRRKIAWVNKIYSTLPKDTWTILLDADELLVYIGYETIPFNSIIESFDLNNITIGAAAMIDMYSNEPVEDNNYIAKYKYFENDFHEEKSYYFKSLYGGIREREFKFNKNRIFLVKKHPVVKKCENTMLVSCHYIYPFKRNFEAVIYFGILHYKLFDSEIEKYKKIAQAGIYGSDSIEYKIYLKTFSEKQYSDIFKIGSNTLKFKGSTSLKKIVCLHNVEDINNV